MITKPTSSTQKIYTPSFATYKKFVQGAVAAGSFFAICLLIQVQYRSGTTIALATLMTGLVIALGYILLYFKTSSFMITETEIQHRSLFRTTVFNRSDIRSLLVNYGATNPSLMMLMIANPTFTKKIRLNGGLWSQKDQQEIIALLKGENILPQGTISARALYKTHPQFVRGIERGFGLSPAASVVAIIITTLVVIGAVVFVGVMFNSGAWHLPAFRKNY